jgi:carotenoid cleavage dioxygenase-like enzyme
MKQGGEHWQWSPETPFYLGVMPRRGAKAEEVKVRLHLPPFYKLQLK